jgi:hypothetical protein
MKKYNLILFQHSILSCKFFLGERIIENREKVIFYQNTIKIKWNANRKKSLHKNEEKNQHESVFF